MKKPAIAVALSLGLAVTLAGCTGGSSSGGDAGGDEKVNLVVWESNDAREGFIKQAGEAYTAEHPNVTIEYKNVELTDTTAQIALDGPAGVGADVFAGGSNATGELVAGGHILPVADPDSLTASLAESALAGVTYENEIYGVPVTIDTFALFYNKAYVTDPPKTWADVITFSEKFSAENPGKYGIAFNPSAYYSSPFLFSAPDSLLFGPEGIDPETPNTDSETAIEGLKQLVELRKVIDVPADDLETSITDTLFESGQSALTLTGSWNIAPFEAAGLDFGVTTLPALKGSDTPAGSFGNSRTMYVSAYTDHPDEAQDFAAFLASPEMLELAYEVVGSIPSADIELSSETSAGLVAQGEYAFASPSIPEAAQYWTAMDSAVKNIWNGADIEAELKSATEVILNQ